MILLQREGDGERIIVILLLCNYMYHQQLLNIIIHTLTTPTHQFMYMNTQVCR